MGNHRFRLSDILMPNAWFHKLKVMSRGSRSPALHHATKKPHSSRTLGSSPSTPKPPAPPHLPAEQLCLQPRRASYYFPSGRQEKPPGSPAHPRASDTHFPFDPPRKSKKKARRKQAKPSHKLVSSDSAGSWSCRATRGAVWEGDAMPDLPTATAPERPPCLQKEVYADADADDEDADGSVPCFDKLIIAQHYGNCDSVTAWSGSCSCKVASPARVDVVMDVPSSTSPATAKLELLALPPILTKLTKKEPEPTTKLEDSKHMSSKAKSSRKQVSLPPLKDTQKSSISPRRPSPPGAQGLRLRGATSPRLASKKLRECRSRKAAAPTPKRTLSESFAVVKSSSDPQRDFRDSMMEMIMENNIRASADLEDLLACYLSLNSNEYHDVIVKVFEQIWLDLTDAKCREVRRLSHCKRG